MEKLNLSKLPALGLIALIVINVGLALGAILPLALSFSKQTQLIDDRLTELVDAPRGPARTSPDARRIITLAPALKTIAVPEKTELAFITALEELAAAHAITINIRLSPPPAGSDAKGYERFLGVDLALAGDARAVGRFLAALEAEDAVAIVKTFSVNAASGGAPGAVTAELSAHVAWPEPL